jgi:flagellar protein FlaG
VKINSVSAEIGPTLHDAPPRTAPATSLVAKSERPIPAELVGLGHANSQDAHRQSNPIVNGMGLSLEFSVDANTGTQVIKVIDRNSGDVVRQIPPEEVLAFLEQMNETKGVFVSRRL